MCTKGIDCLQAHTIQTNAFLKSLAIILAASVKFAHGIHHLALRYTPAIVAYTHTKIVFNGDFNAVARSHLELVNTIINCFFQQHIDTIVGL